MSIQQRVIHDPPTLEEFRKGWTCGHYTVDTDTLCYYVYECWPDTNKHTFAHIKVSLQAIRDLLKVIGPVFDVEVRLYGKTVGHALYRKDEAGKIERLRLRKGREVMDTWEQWL